MPRFLFLCGVALMHHRTFEDRAGVVWRVSEVPADIRGAELERERRDTPRSKSRASAKGKLLTTRPHAWLYFSDEGDKMTDEMDKSTNSLSDAELLDREAQQRDEFLRLEEFEPQLRDTTYRMVVGSRPLIHAWDRWTRTSVAVRLRGLLPLARKG
jgi:hypothetical protein